jgi:hypothetical protein
MKKKKIVGFSFLIIYYFFSLLLIISSQYLIRTMSYTLIIMSILSILMIVLYSGKIIGLVICYLLWNFVSVLISVFVSIIVDQKYSSTLGISIYKSMPIFFRFLLSNDLFILLVLTIVIIYNIPVFLIAKNVKNW